MVACGEFLSPLGFPVHVTATRDGLRSIDLRGHSGARCAPRPRDPVVAEAIRQLREYFDGVRRDFDLPLDPGGTPFQNRVWQALRTIPYGQTRSYADIARAVGAPNGFRAVGAANGRNPLPVVVPCHRVIASNGKLQGFAYGLEVKRRLLDLETYGIGIPEAAAG